MKTIAQYHICTKPMSQKFLFLQKKEKIRIYATDLQKQNQILISII